MPQLSSDRIESVRRATKRWQSDLVDTTGRNRLRLYRDLKTSTLDLTLGQAHGLDAGALDRLLADKPVSLIHLFPVDSGDFTAFNDARRRLTAIHKMYLTNSEEKGIETLYAAIGLATWKVDTGTPPNAPVILLPLDVKATGAAVRDFDIKVAGDAHLNPVLAHILRTEYDIKTDDDEADVAEDPPKNLDGFRALLDRLQKSWKVLPNLAIEPRAVAAIFSYSTMPLVTDLEQNGELFAASDIVAAIAGDREARASLASRISDPKPSQPDIDPPENEFLILDADSSQHMAINRVLGGESLVIQGPPGTGKSQTIANLITALIAQGKRILFVAEKRAAIEAVTKRLDQVGLSNLVMDMHGGVTSRRDFARTLYDSLEHIATIPVGDYSALHSRLQERRDSLIANMAALHEPRDPWKLSVFDMRKQLLDIPEAACTQLRLATKDARALDSDGFNRLKVEVEEWVDLGGHSLAENHPEWSRISAEGAKQAFEQISDLARNRLPAARAALFAALDGVSLTHPLTVTEWGQTVDFLSVVEQTLELYVPDLYELNHTSLLRALNVSSDRLANGAIDNFIVKKPEEEEEGFALALSLRDEFLPNASMALSQALAEVNYVMPDTLTECRDTLDFLLGVKRMLERCRPEIYELDHAILCQALAPAAKSGLHRLIAHFFSSRYRSARQAVRNTLREPSEISYEAALDLAIEAGKQGDEWRRRGFDGKPRLPARLGELSETLDLLAKGLATFMQMAKRQWQPTPTLSATANGFATFMQMATVADLDQLPLKRLAKMLDRITEHWKARLAVKQVLRVPTYLSRSDVCAVLEEAEAHLQEWKRRTNSSSKPCVPDDLGAVRSQVTELAENLSSVAKLTRQEGFDQMPHTELAVVLERMVSNRSVAANLPRIRELEARFREAGIGNIIERVGKDIPPEYAARAVEHAWLWRVLEELEFDDRRIAAFDSRRHSRHRDEFAETDRQHRDSTAQRVHRLTAEATIATMNNHPEETRLVRFEAVKKRRHLSVRQLFARAPHVLSTLHPCWTMSPILAAEIIPADLRLFDAVIFDEASQIPPAEAIGSLARAPQAVIAGDRCQLPPTSFFGSSPGDYGDDDEDDDNGLSLTEGIESILDTADALLRNTMLQWHYRSRDDRLIAFSNKHIYGGSLTAFPGATVSTPVTHFLVPFRPITGLSGTRSNPDEVEKVVELVLEHARENPDETLGVIAFGQSHADNIDNALIRRLREMNDPSLDEFFSERNEERFFVKNIERVQGDERDTIILSVGYHKEANGNLPYRFGPILQEGGERRLNVAVTRARSRLTLVSSFSHRDMDPDRSSAKGVELLRQYLEFAASGGDYLGSDVRAVPLNPFELAIKDGLDRRGIPVTPQYGVSGYRIDFACAHPDEPGRMVLAIEADGASYHSAHTARDRDRLRQQVLESKGWRFHRIWSTAWFRDREAELDMAEEAWKRAVEASDKDEPPPPPVASLSIPKINASPQRGPRPNIPRKGTGGYNTIADYQHWHLVSLVRWIESDTLLRTDEDLIREIIDELGFKRSGKRITDALNIAIRDARR